MTMEPYRFTIEVTAPSRAQANAVIAERILYDEDYGFEYEIRIIEDSLVMQDSQESDQLGEKGLVYYGLDGEPITREEWAELFEDFDRRVVVKSKLPNGVEVSTVWVGIDHGYGGGPPLIYETMIFDGPLDGEQMRYSTRPQAIAGHVKMLKLAKEGAHSE